MTSPLALLATFLLAAGGLLALLVPPGPVATPIAAAAPLMLLAFGVLATSLHALLRRDAASGSGALLLALLCLAPALPPLRGHVPTAATFALLVLAAAAFRSLHLQGAAFTLLITGLVLTAVLGISQWWHQLDAAENFALSRNLELAATERGRAFLASDRATGTSVVANTFAATLLLALPFLVLAAVRARRRVVPLILLGCVGGAFLAAGSAGATLAALAAIAICCWPAEAPWRRVGRGAALVFVLAIVLLLAVPQWDAAPEWLALKSASLAERADFQTLALRLFEPAGLLQGVGWGHFAPLAEGVLQPGEVWSSSPHSVPLQLALEGGVLLALAALVATWWALRTTRHGAAEAIATTAPTPFLALRSKAPLPSSHARGAPTEFAPPHLDAPLIPRPDVGSRAALAGGLFAALLAPLLVPMLTPLPLDFDHPFLASAVMGFAFLIAWRCSASLVTLPCGRGALGIGVAAFLLHGLLDADLFRSPAAAALMFALAASLPALCASRLRAGVTAILVMWVAVLLVAHVGTAGSWQSTQGAARSEGTSADAAHAEEALEAAAQHALATGELDALEDAGPYFAARGMAGIAALSAALPPLLHGTPRARLLTLRVTEAALRAQRISNTEALASCRSCVHTGSMRSAEILLTASRIAAAAGEAGLAASWRTAAAASAECWGTRRP